MTRIISGLQGEICTSGSLFNNGILPQLNYQCQIIPSWLPTLLTVYKGKLPSHAAWTCNLDHK